MRPSIHTRLAEIKSLCEHADDERRHMPLGHEIDRTCPEHEVMPCSIASTRWPTCVKPRAVTRSVWPVRQQDYPRAVGRIIRGE